MAKVERPKLETIRAWRIVSEKIPTDKGGQSGQRNDGEEHVRASLDGGIG